MRLVRRIRLGLLAAALLLVAATGWRAFVLADARARIAAHAVPLEVDHLDGGVLITVEGDEVLAAVGPREVDLRDGPLRVGAAEIELVSARARRREILRRDWAVYAHPERGFRRIDVGPDPTGARDGVRDRIVVAALDEAKTGWFHLTPPGPGSEPRFQPGDRAAWLVAEQDGLEVSGGDGTPTARPPAGGRVRVQDRFTVSHAASDTRLSFAWVDTARAAPVLDARGRVQGYRDARGVDLVVRAEEPAEDAHPQLLVQLDGSTRRLPLTPHARLLLHGRKDPLRPFLRGLLPGRAADRQLEAAVADGLADGWIAVDPAGTHVTIPSDGDAPAPGMTWALARSVVQLIDGYDRARAPLAVRLGPGLVGAAATCDDAGMRFDPELAAWTPTARPRDGVQTCRVPVAPDAGFTWIETAVPSAWASGDGDLSPLPGQRGTWTRHAVEPVGALVVRLDGRPTLPGPDRVAASIAGGPPGTALVAEGVRLSGRGFGGWDGATGAAEEAARSVWTRVPGDRWRVEGSAPPPLEDRARPVFLRIPVTAQSAGWMALDLTIPGAVRSARWNGDAVALPDPGPDGGRRVSLKLRRGPNLFALHVERPATAPVPEAGGTRFVTDGSGTPTGLASHVAERRARHAVRSERTETITVDRDAADAPSLFVDRAAPGLPEGLRWQLAPARGRAAEAELVLAAGPGVLLENDFGALVLTRDGLAWDNGSRLTLGGVRRVETDPDGPPLAGFKVAPGTRWALSEDGQAVAGPDFRLRARPDCGPDDIAAALVVVHAGRVACVEVLGRPRWAPLDDSLPATRLRLRTDGLESVTVATSRPATLWDETAQATAVAASSTLDRGVEWAPGAWLVIPGTSLRLRRPWPEDEAALRVPVAAHSGRVTVDDDLQARALQAMDAHLARQPAEALDDTHALRGAVLVMDAVDGDILACAARDRDGVVDPRACWEEHDLRPGSTFKIATAAAALRSADPTVRALLEGRHPSGLSRTGGSGSLEDARLPRLPPGSGPDRSLRTRLRNFRNKPMAADLDLDGALAGSVNTWFGYLGLLLHEPLRAGWGDAAIADPTTRAAAWPVLQVAAEAGLGERFELAPGVWGTGGSAPHDAADSDAAIAARAIGQDAVRATPLGIARLVSMVASGGEIPAPRLDPDRDVARRRVLSRSAAERLQAALSAVVVKGTAARAFADHPWRSLVLGKTGSAQRIDARGMPRTDSWFAGAVLPPDDLEGNPVVIVVALPGAGLGGRHAAEVADEVSRAVIVANGWDRSEVVTARW